jgi:hypothetical protein
VLGDLPVAGGRRAYDKMVERAVRRSIHGIVVHLASLDDIIASKEHADRDKDRQALPGTAGALAASRPAGQRARIAGGSGRRASHGSPFFSDTQTSAFCAR